jgi:NADPH2:quinone reductase
MALRLAEIVEPTPADGRLLIAVEHVSLNVGDLNDARSARVRREECSARIFQVAS